MRDRVLGVIPARGGSKGVPRKNVRTLGGRPLIAWTIDVAVACGTLHDFFVSTEDAEIAEIARANGAKVIPRPERLADDRAPTAPTLLHALRWAEENSGGVYDAVCTLQPTSPFRTAADVDASVRLLLDTDADSVVSVVRLIDAHPRRAKRVVDGWLADYCEPESESARRQDLSPAYLRNGAVYVTRRSVIERGTVEGERRLAYEMPAARSVNIDEPLDLLLARAMVNGKRETDE